MSKKNHKILKNLFNSRNPMVTLFSNNPHFLMNKQHYKTILKNLITDRNKMI